VWDLRAPLGLPDPDLSPVGPPMAQDPTAAPPAANDAAAGLVSSSPQPCPAGGISETAVLAKVF